MLPGYSRAELVAEKDWSIKSSVIFSYKKKAST